MKKYPVMPLLFGIALSSFNVAYGGSITPIKIHGFVNYDTVNGYNSQSTLVQREDGSLIGTTCSGGINSVGTIFVANTNGSQFQTLLSFDMSNGGYIGGGYIAGPIFGKDGQLYGTTRSGGANLAGEVYRETVSGVNVFSFTGGDDGEFPYAGLVLGVDGNLYGTTTSGGWFTFLDPNAVGYGTVFQITAAGSFNTLHSFNGSDGSNSRGNLVQGKDGVLYGTTVGGGASGWGTVFKITTNGIFTTLYSFTGYGDGARPVGGLVQGSDNNVYGTTYSRGAYTSSDSTGYGYGTAFKITSAGILTTLMSFDNTNGSRPNSTLVLGRDGNFYGTTEYGLTDYPPIPGIIANFGTIFKMTSSGTITTLTSFDYMSGYGAYPNSLMQATDGNLYGTCQNGGTYFGASGGIIFRLNLPPRPVFGGTSAIGGKLKTTLSGLSSGSTVVLQVSSDLKNWTPITTTVVNGSTLSFTNTINPAIKGQYFRAMVQ
jgi:uncharacterized repeat protein (TIGR03803 family)